MTARRVLRLAEAVSVDSRNMEGSCECTEQAVAEKRWPSSLGAALGANQRFTVNKNKLCC
jgi:hypothetical protein